MNKIYTFAALAFVFSSSQIKATCKITYKDGEFKSEHLSKKQCETRARTLNGKIITATEPISENIQTQNQAILQQNNKPCPTTMSGVVERAIKALERLPVGERTMKANKNYVNELNLDALCRERCKEGRVLGAYSIESLRQKNVLSLCPCFCKLERTVKGKKVSDPNAYKALSDKANDKKNPTPF